MGNKQFTHEVHGMDELVSEVKKTSADSKKNYTVALIAAIASVLGFVVAIISLWRTW